MNNDYLTRDIALRCALGGSEHVRGRPRLLLAELPLIGPVKQR